MVHLRGVGAVRFGKGLDPGRMVREASGAALSDAGLTADEIDHVVVANSAAEGFLGQANVAVWTVTQAGLVGTPALRVETGPSSGLAGLAVARALVAGGLAEHVLLVGWEAMTGPSTEATTELLAHYMATDERAHELSLPALVAMLTSAYLAQHPVTPEELARLPVKAHRLAATNPIAQFQGEITVDDVLASRMIADPLRLYHCAPISDGAAALVLSTQGPVELAGMGHATDALGFTQRRGPVERFQATEQAARAAYAQARLGPEDVDVAEVHDAFSILEAVNVEDLCLAEPGAGVKLLLADEDPVAGDPVVNPSGGLKARGHPVGATGVAQLVELYGQLTGHAANQVHEPRVGLAHNIGGFGNNVHVALLRASAGAEVDA